MSQPAKAQEPSMEEILASIRRIIADDDTGKPPAKPRCGRSRRATAGSAAAARRCSAATSAAASAPAGTSACGRPEPS